MNNFDTRSVMSMATDNQEKFASAKMLASKAAAGTYNIGVRIAAMEELEKGMNLLEKIRSTIGERKFSDGVNDIYKNLPKYSTFRDDVQVIDVDKDGDNDNNPSTAPAAAKKDRIALASEDDSIPAPATKDTSIDVDSGDDDSDDDDFTDGNGGIDLEKMFPNKPGGVEFTYERDATGRVVSVSARPVAARDVRNKKRSNGDEDNE